MDHDRFWHVAILQAVGLNFEAQVDILEPQEGKGSEGIKEISAKDDACPKKRLVIALFIRPGEV
jgi:hypothetical protein